MLCPGDFFKLLASVNIDFYAGVPDSLLKDFCSFLADHAAPESHFITANEGSAIALATGYHLASGKAGLVYMQNSGLGNAINPLLSLADSEVYSIPVLLIIGWRGEPGRHDEPQHKKQGRVMLSMLDAMEIPYEVLPDTLGDAAVTIQGLLDTMRDRVSPVALIVHEGTFAAYAQRAGVSSGYSLAREAALQIILDHLNADDIVVATTGKTSREIYEYRDYFQQGHSNDFLTVGSMGHSSQIALGIALHRPGREVYCIDGDGAAIMHMGGLTVAGSRGPGNFRHIILNNGVHDSVGGQPTAGFDIDFTGVARSCGYSKVLRADSGGSLITAMKELVDSAGPSLLEVRICAGSRTNLGRPKTTPRENKTSLMEFLAHESENLLG